MKVVSYKKVREFLEDNYSKLIEHEITTQLLLYSAIINQEITTHKDCIYGKVMDGNKNTILLFCNRLPNNLLINAVSDIGLEEAVNELTKYFIKHKILLNGINGKKELCELVIKYINYHLSNKMKERYQFKENLALDIMALTSLRQVEVKAGRTRLANIEELGLITNYIVNFYREALHEEVYFEEQIPKVERLIHNNKIYVFENILNQVVTMAATTRTLVNGVCINYVYTPNEFRGLGYAKVNVYNICKGILDDGYRFCSLFVDKSNPISNQVYIDIGFEIIEDQYAYEIR